MTFAEGKTIVITGANSGIGFETAKNLSRYAKELIFICRNTEKAQSAFNAIRSAGAECEITLAAADLSCAQSICEAVSYIEKTYSSIDILINNAGGIFFTRKETTDGLEYTFGLNHMGYFRLTKGFIPLLKESSEARIINIASAAHRYRALNFSDLQHRNHYQGFIVYARSKLANILFSRESARRLTGTNISSVSLHPGFISSNFAHDTGGTFGGGLFMLLSSIVGKPSWKGAETPTFLACTKTVINGAYYTSKKPSIPARHALDDEAAARLWSISEQLG